MKSPATTLETLLDSFDKNEAMNSQTEQLRSRLQGEINDALASGDLNESMASAIQLKRTQLELVPSKLTQLAARRDELISAIQNEFQIRYAALDRTIGKACETVRQKVLVHCNIDF